MRAFCLASGISVAAVNVNLSVQKALRMVVIAAVTLLAPDVWSG